MLPIVRAKPVKLFATLTVKPVIEEMSVGGQIVSIPREFTLDNSSSDLAHPDSQGKPYQWRTVKSNL